MKKLITILAVMIVLVGTAFATTDTRTAQNPSSANIDITAAITAVFPQFTLSTSGDNVAAQTAAEGETKTAALTAPTAALLGGGTNVTVAFAIKQASTARVSNSYTLTVTATPMKLVEFLDADGIPVVTPPTEDEIAINTFALASGSATPTIGSLHAAVQKGEQGHEVTVGEFTATNNVLTAAYNGTVTVADLGQGADTLGTFSVTWVGDSSVAAGNYKATVTLQVAAL